MTLSATGRQCAWAVVSPVFWKLHRRTHVSSVLSLSSCPSEWDVYTHVLGNWLTQWRSQDMRTVLAVRQEELRT